MAAFSRLAAITPWGKAAARASCLFARAGCRFRHEVSCAACVDSLLHFFLPAPFFAGARRPPSACPQTLNDRELSMWCGVDITQDWRWLWPTGQIANGRCWRSFLKLAIWNLAG